MPGEGPESLIGAVLGGYRLVDKLGEGGMGAVYKGYDESLDRHVAVKILPQALAADASYVQRFTREARAVAKLHHPNLVHIYSVGEERGLHYFAMEMIDGEPLSTRIARQGPMPFIDAIRFLGQTMSALAKVHELGIVHRDIKSSNIMITPDGRAILMDFGLAKGGELAQGVTTPGIVLGTPEYMSPEQALGEQTDAQSDIYALGVLLFEMVTGRLPFTGKSAIAVIRQHAESAPPRPSAVRHDVPRPLDEVILTAMEKDRSVRFRDISQMAAALLRVGRTRELMDLAGAAADAAGAPRTSDRTAAAKPHAAPRGDRGALSAAKTVADRTAQPTLVDSPGDELASGAPTMVAPQRPGDEPVTVPAPALQAKGSSARAATTVVVLGLVALAIFIAVLGYTARRGRQPLDDAKTPAVEVSPAGEGPVFNGRLLSVTRDGDRWIAVFRDESGKKRTVEVKDLRELRFKRPAGDKLSAPAVPRESGSAP